MSEIKRVYFFGGKSADGDGSMKNLLGGKGANLAEMTSLGLPVPEGFTVSTEACTKYYQDGKKLAQLMIDYNIGVSTRAVYEIKRIDLDYFEE